MGSRTWSPASLATAFLVDQVTTLGAASRAGGPVGAGP